MVKIIEEIARKHDVVLRRKAEKLYNGLKRRYRPIIPLQKAFLVIQQNDLFCVKYSVLVYK